MFQWSFSFLFCFRYSSVIDIKISYVPVLTHRRCEVVSRKIKVRTLDVAMRLGTRFYVVPDYFKALLLLYLYS